MGHNSHSQEASDSAIVLQPKRRARIVRQQKPLILRAFRGDPVERPPLWLMRQAGRFLPEYRAIRAEHSFLEVCRSPELATEVTLQPIRRFGMDAAILFSDILLVLDAMGAGLQFDSRGPWFERPIRSIYDVSYLKPIDPDRDLPYVSQAIRQIRKELSRETPLLGFAGAPFTLLTYLMEGKGERAAASARSLLIGEPKLAGNILARISDAVATQLTAQIEAGVAAVQIFESGAGNLTRELWRKFAAPAVRRVVCQIRRFGVPIIYFTRGTKGLLPALAEVDADVYGLDWQCDLNAVRTILGPNVSVQGNLDPAVLLTTPDVIRKSARALIEKGGPLGYTFNLGHGVLPQTNPELVRILVETVKDFTFHQR